MNNDFTNFNAEGLSFLKKLSPQDFLNFGLQEGAYIRLVFEDGQQRYSEHAANGVALSILDDENDALSAIFQNDLVGMGDGTVTDRAGTASVAGYIFGSIAASTLNIGAFNGCFYNDPTTQKPTWKNYYPGSINITQGKIDAFVYDNPQQLFEVQSSGTLTQADMGNLVDLGTYAAGSTINGHSKEEVSGTSKSSTAMCRLIRLTEDPSNSDTSSANANWIVRLNESIYYARVTKATT